MSRNIGTRSILVLSSDPCLVDAVMDVAAKLGAEVVQTKTAIDLISIGADIQIVDRTCTKEWEWKIYLDYVDHMRDASDMGVHYPELIDSPIEDRTPLIIIDNLPPIIAEECYPDPTKPEGSLIYSSFTAVDELKTRVEELLDA